MKFFMQDPNIFRLIICKIMHVYITYLSHRKKWKKSIISFIYLHMNQMPWTCPHRLKNSSNRKWKRLFLFCSRSNRENILYRWEAASRCYVYRTTRDGGGETRFHTCVNNTKQHSRFISGRKTNRLEPDILSPSISSCLTSHRVFVPYSHRITSH